MYTGTTHADELNEENGEDEVVEEEIQDKNGRSKY